MIFFDFLYYQIYRFYFDFNEKGAESTSSCIVGGFQALNVLTGVLLFELAFHKNIKVDKLQAVIMCVAFQIFTYYRYNYKNSHSVDIIEKKWSDKTEVWSGYYAVRGSSSLLVPLLKLISIAR
jgi:hypothetical protein